MLTIRTIHPSGSESVFQARHIIVEPPGPARRRVSFYDEAFEPVHVAGLPYVEYGTVYAMNESGRTVATYDLNEPERAQTQTSGQGQTEPAVA